MRVTTSGGGFCGFCGSFSQTVDIACFSRFWSCGSLVVFACGFVVLWIACGFWIARSALRVRNGKSPLKATRRGINPSLMRVLCAQRTACEMGRVAPTNRPQNRQMHMMWFLSSLWFFAVFVFFCRLCGFWASLWISVPKS